MIKTLLCFKVVTVNKLANDREKFSKATRIKLLLSCGIVLETIQLVTDPGPTRNVIRWNPISIYFPLVFHIRDRWDQRETGIVLSAMATPHYVQIYIYGSPFCGGGVSVLIFYLLSSEYRTYRRVEWVNRFSNPARRFIVNDSRTHSPEDCGNSLFRHIQTLSNTYRRMSASLKWKRMKWDWPLTSET